MRYEFYGKKLPYAGKTLWEIVGNLKNFGVGRYIKKCAPDHIKGPCFFKILDVQCFAPPRQKFIERKVLIWTEEWYNGLKISRNIICKNSNVAKFQLIPKCEEHIYIQAAEEFSKNFVKKDIPKYINCPPLFKILWEREHKKLTGKDMEIPNIETIVLDSSLLKVNLREDLSPVQENVSLHKLDTPVEDLIQEVITLKRKVNFLKKSSQ